MIVGAGASGFAVSIVQNSDSRPLISLAAFSGVPWGNAGAKVRQSCTTSNILCVLLSSFCTICGVSVHILHLLADMLGRKSPLFQHLSGVVGMGRRAEGAGQQGEGDRIK